MKKSCLLFILILSAFLAFSCSDNDDEEELTDTDSNSSQDADNSGDTLPDETSNDDDKTDTASESDDSDISDDHNDKDDVDTSDIISDSDNSETTDDHDSDQTDPTDDTDTTDDDDPGIIIPDIPVVFGNICTGQTKCYDETAEINCPAKGEAFYGQDAEYAKSGKCIPQKFTVKGTGDEKIVLPCRVPRAAPWLCPCATV